MAVDLSYDIWNELKRYISTIDREDAADSLVTVLIDNDYDAEQIRSAFKSDSDIKRALKSYLDDTDEDLDEEDEYEEDN
jgi:hypothetical protein